MMRTITVAAGRTATALPLSALAVSPDCRESAEILDVYRQNYVHCISPDRSDFAAGSAPVQADVSGAGAGDMEQVPGSVFLDPFEIASSATASIRSATGSRRRRKS
jgi:hypothetical protein